MRPDFQRDAAARHAPEDFLQRFCTRTNSLFQLYLTCLIHDAVPAVAIAQIQSDGQLLLRNIPTLRSRSDANLLHCRSPFYLCFEHVDNLGAYTASRPETGLLIPSCSVSCACRAHSRRTQWCEFSATDGCSKPSPPAGHTSGYSVYSNDFPSLGWKRCSQSISLKTEAGNGFSSSPFNHCKCHASGSRIS